MLDEKDMQSLKSMMESVVNERISKSENLILEEMDRNQSTMDKKIETVQKNLEELKQYYRITKLENDNTALLLKMIESLQKDVEELKKKTA